jgi:hypothetical protein
MRAVSASGSSSGSLSVAIMQPYLLPYIGYFQLIAAVDLFIAYDNIKYTKKGWINRNRMLRNGAAAVFSIPLRHGSDTLDICEREIAPEFRGETLLAQIHGAYRRAPNFDPTYALLEQILRSEERNLFLFLEQSIIQTCRHLSIATKVERSSRIEIGNGLRGQDRVIATCRAVGAHRYVNAIGGVDLYDRRAFEAKGLDLRFVQSQLPAYEQFGAPSVPHLSILDVLMFNPQPVVADWVHTAYRLI